jgi:hypothetical protein
VSESGLTENIFLGKGSGLKLYREGGDLSACFMPAVAAADARFGRWPADAAAICPDARQADPSACGR